MELLRERTTTETYDAGLAERHNAMIKERYRRLQSAEADQFAEETYTERNHSEATPTVAVEENVDTSVRSTASIFTAEKFENLQGFHHEEAQVKVAAPQITQKPKAVVAVEERYGLTPLAKILMAVFTLVVIAMISLICVNTQIIHQKTIKIKNLEQKKEQLMEQNEEIQLRLQQAQSPEAIEEYALANGMVKAS